MEPNNQYEYNREPWEQPTRVVTRTRIWPIVLTAVGTALITLMLCIVFLGGRTNGSKRPSPTKPAEESGSSSGQEEAQKENYADKLEEIKAYIDAYFIGEVDEGQLADKAAAGMIEGLDDEWSYYIPAEEYASYIESVTNSYVGIGVTITSEGVEKGLLVKDVTPESPAYRAGMEIGDLITAVEGVPVLDGSEEAIDLIETKNRVRGPEGTQVTITVVHEGVARDLTITRETIKMVNVTGQSLDNGLYYIRIGNFEQDAAKDTIAKIEEAKAQGAKGIIFDVRYNPGGYKRELVELLDYLLPAGPLFRSLDYAGRESVDNSDEKYLDLPMAVLVNYNSYSAAEFFGAALQEYEAAAIVGQQTYGKGRFQTAFELSDGSAINISIGQYTTPMGVSLVGKGITPDFVVELSEEEEADLYYGRLSFEEDDQLQKAIEVLTN